MYYLCLTSCLNVNRPEAMHFHYHHEPWGEWWERIKPHLILRRISTEKAITDYEYSDPQLKPFRYAHLADFARLKILVEEGGIYADIDTLFLRPFPQHWLEREFILGQEKPPAAAATGGSLCNAWIASSSGASFCKLWLESMWEAFDGSWSNHSTLLPYQLWKQHPTLLNVEPESAFYALDWSPKSIADLFLRNVPLPEHAYSLHLWNHLWFSPQRLDFSHFHEGMLTVDYVRHANTTYAQHARAHLPPDVQGSASAYHLQSLASKLQYPIRSARVWMNQGEQI